MAMTEPQKRAVTRWFFNQDPVQQLQDFGTLLNMLTGSQQDSIFAAVKARVLAVADAKRAAAQAEVDDINGT